MKLIGNSFLSILVLILLSSTVYAESTSIDSLIYPQKAVINSVPVVIYTLEQDKKILYTLENNEMLEKEIAQCEETGILLREILDEREEQQFVLNEKIGTLNSLTTKIALDRDLLDARNRVLSAELNIIETENKALGKKLKRAKTWNKVLGIALTTVIGGVVIYATLK